MKKTFLIIFVLLVLFTTSNIQAQNGDKSPKVQISQQEMFYRAFQNAMEAFRVVIIADSSGEGTPASSALQDSIKNRIIETMTYYNSMITLLGSAATTTTQSNIQASVDSIKGRIIELMSYNNIIIARLDSLFNYARADSLNTVQLDSVNNTYDSLIVNYTTWVKYSFSGDSTFVIDFDRNFTNPKIFAPGTGYTITLPIDGHNRIYMKKASIFAGYMKRNLIAEGK